MSLRKGVRTLGWIALGAIGGAAGSALYLNHIYSESVTTVRNIGDANNDGIPDIQISEGDRTRTYLSTKTNDYIAFDISSTKR